MSFIPGINPNDQNAIAYANLNDERRSQIALNRAQANQLNTQNQAQMDRLMAELESKERLTDKEADLAVRIAHITGNYGLLNALMSRGGMTNAQYQTATARYDSVQDSLNNAQGLAQGIATGGGLTQSEYQGGLDTAYQGVMDQAKNAAENAYNQRATGSSPFAAASILSAGAANAGAARANQRANYDIYQADSRKEGIGMMGNVAGQQMQAANQLSQLDTAPIVPDGMEGLYGQIAQQALGGVQGQGQNPGGTSNIPVPNIGQPPSARSAGAQPPEGLTPVLPRQQNVRRNNQYPNY